MQWLRAKSIGPRQNLKEKTWGCFEQPILFWGNLKWDLKGNLNLRPLIFKVHFPLDIWVLVLEYHSGCSASSSSVSCSTHRLCHHWSARVHSLETSACHHPESARSNGSHGSPEERRGRGGRGWWWWWWRWWWGARDAVVFLRLLDLLWWMSRMIVVGLPEGHTRRHGGPAPAETRQPHQVPGLQGDEAPAARGLPGWQRAHVRGGGEFINGLNKIIHFYLSHSSRASIAHVLYTVVFVVFLKIFIIDLYF